MAYALDGQLKLISYAALLHEDILPNRNAEEKTDHVT